MKKIILFFLTAMLFSIDCFGQTINNNVYKQGEVMKVPLLEKFNLPARKLPQLLIKAYCEGLIQAYYPLDIDSACSYHNFMHQFGFGKTQPIPSAGEFTNIQCPQSFCNDPDNPILDQFKHSFELIQNKRFDANTSTEVYDIKYVRLIYVKERDDQMFDLLGPVFKYEDVIALIRDDFKLANPKNGAADITLKQYFTKRMFHGYILQASPQKSYNPGGKKGKEKDTWEQ